MVFRSTPELDVLAPFVFEVYGLFYTCGSVAMVLISFWLHLMSVSEALGS